MEESFLSKNLIKCGQPCSRHGKMIFTIKFTLTSILCTILVENKSDGKFNKNVTDCP